VTVQVNVWAADVPLASVAVTETEYGLPVSAPAEIVPEITPLLLIVSPGGRPVAL
jgi:hypothetical protein